MNGARRFLLSTWGSSGDLHPFLALGAALRRRGHQVTLVGFPAWETKARAAGLDFVAAGVDLPLEDFHVNPELFSTRNFGINSLRVLMREFVAPTFPALTAALIEAAPRHDCLVAHSFMLVAPMVAELTRLRFASLSLAPGVIPSGWSMPAGAWHDPFRGAVGRFVNRTLWRIGMAMIRPEVDPIINRIRAQHGRPPVRDAALTSVSHELHLQLYSPAFAPRAPDWPAALVHAGFCFWDEMEAWAPPPELQKFLAGGEKPLLFTLGSSAVFHPDGFYQSAVAAVRKSGRRAILLLGREVNRPAHLPANILALDYAPYAWLMPRCAAVAHQCGIGTTAQALRAGCPMILCPYAFDQPNNAMRLRALGVGVLLRRHERSPSRMERAVEAVLGDPSFRQRAETLAAQIAREDGPAMAVECLERFGV